MEEIGTWNRADIVRPDVRVRLEGVSLRHRVGGRSGGEVREVAAEVAVRVSSPTVLRAAGPTMQLPGVFTSFQALTSTLTKRPQHLCHWRFRQHVAVRKSNWMLSHAKSSTLLLGEPR